MRSAGSGAGRGKPSRIAAVGLVGVTGLLLACSAVGVAGAAPRQDYPDVPDNEPGATEVTCALQGDSLTAGEQASVKVGGIEDGTVVRVYVGSELATEQAVDASNPTITFVVPDVPSGPNDVTLVGPTFTVSCFGGAEVLGISVENSGGARSGAGRLAFTGLEVGLLVLLAAVALTIGLLARRASQQRQRTAGVR
jgi:hypothetical protein